MSYFRQYPIRDSFIGSNTNPDNDAGMYDYRRNYGDDSVLDLSITSSSAGSTYTRILMQFNISPAQLNALTGSYTATLNIFNCRNFKFTDEMFHVELFPVTQSWIEGIGSTLYPVSGAVSFVDRIQNTNWSVSGGSFSSSPSASLYFDAGTENLTANVSAFIEYWKTQPNYGLMIKFPNAVESSTSVYQNYKSFYARNTQTVFKPYLEVVYPTSNLIKDDIRNLHLGTNLLYIYDNNVGATAYPGSAVMMTDSTLTSSTAYPMSYVQPNIWTISFTASQIDYDELLLVYSNTALGYSVTSSVTGTQVSTGFSTNNATSIHAKMYMQKTYRADELPVFSAVVYRYVNFRMGTVSVRYYPAKVSLYLMEKNTRLRSSPDQEMGYNADGYNIQMDMTQLNAGFYYIPVLKIEDNGQVVYRECPEAEFYVQM